ETKERPRQRPRDKHRRPKGKQRHKVEVEEENRGDKESAKTGEEESAKETHASLLKEKRPPPSVDVIDGVGDDSAANGPPDNDGNTALVAVFVVIMVLILVAGVIWKFELHKKIFQARYQTVAGG
uniref:Uncharacterized protein n=1 Tax=Romanomermis culicivorax TaxID=13658 RepID=A0A915K6W3_ROMCU